MTYPIVYVQPLCDYCKEEGHKAAWVRPNANVTCVECGIALTS